MSLEDFERLERDGWSDPSIAEGYARGFDAATRHVAEVLAGRVEAGPDRTILDLCAGHGVVSRALVERGASVTGLDFSPAMVALAQSSVPSATFLEGDAAAMPFADGAFDAVAIGFGVPHLPDPDAAFREIARVLRPGGRLAFSVWRGAGSDGAFGWLLEALADHGDPDVVLPPGPDAHQFAQLAAARAALLPAGFEYIRSEDVASEGRMANPEDLFDIFHDGAVRAAALLGRQPADRQTRIRAHLAQRVVERGRRDGGACCAPFPSVVVSARRH